ncbi:unnamed protein product [Timema podura]|uniref:Uncharacterized protein n=1 Tax=Timema podura TaxID=61482 RepID=A0ABN7PF93_TIMPD|nr:unnamed protein product [Timema podura]
MSVGLIDCYPAMLVLVYGAMCSIGVLVLEILVYKREKSRITTLTPETLHMTTDDDADRRAPLLVRFSFPRCVVFPRPPALSVFACCQTTRSSFAPEK